MQCSRDSRLPRHDRHRRRRATTAVRLARRSDRVSPSVAGPCGRPDQVRGRRRDDGRRAAAAPTAGTSAGTDLCGEAAPHSPSTGGRTARRSCVAECERGTASFVACHPAVRDRVRNGLISSARQQPRGAGARLRRADRDHRRIVTVPRRVECDRPRGRPSPLRAARRLAVLAGPVVVGPRCARCEACASASRWRAALDAHGRELAAGRWPLASRRLAPARLVAVARAGRVAAFEPPLSARPHQLAPDLCRAAPRAPARDLSSSPRPIACSTSGAFVNCTSR